MTTHRAPRVFIAGGDTDYNRGDKAILMGMVQALKSAIPDIEITIPAMAPVRYAQEFQVRAVARVNVPQIVQALNWADLVLWGGGVALQDDTSRVKVPFWLIRQILTTQVLRKPVMGIAGGIGPLQTGMGRRLAGMAANMSHLMVTRDQGAADLLLELGVAPEKVRSAACTAMLLKGQSLEAGRALLAKEGIPVDRRPLVGLATRLWFHHSSGWLPHEWSIKLGLTSLNEPPKRFTDFSSNLARLADWLVEEHGAYVVFFPMYTVSHESDQKFSEDTRALMKHSDQATTLIGEYPIIDFASAFTQLDTFIGVRMHSTILATIANVPSITFYYVPKGVKYFRMIGQEQYAYDINKIADGELTDVQAGINRIFANPADAKASLLRGVQHVQALAQTNIDYAIEQLQAIGFDIKKPVRQLSQ